MTQNQYLIWMDLEMTGLDPLSDRILEIALVVTDIDLNIIEDGIEYVIHQNDDILEEMNDWCKEHHGQSGLVDKVKSSKLTIAQAEEEIIVYLQRFIKEGDAPLCGNSIHQDRSFLAAYMPRMNNYFHYRNVDVSSLKELSYRWYPHLPKFKKENKHTALEDVYESIDELKYYREKLFISM